jgi:hypothetical protein
MSKENGHLFGGRLGYADGVVGLPADLSADLSREMIAPQVMSVTTDTYTSAERINQACEVMVLMLLLPCEGVEHRSQDLRYRPRKAAEENSHHRMVHVESQSGQCRSGNPRGLSQFPSQFRRGLS